MSNGKMLLLPCFSNKLTYSGFSENPVDDPDEDDDRGHWGSKAEFILSCVGFSVRPFFNYTQLVLVIPLESFQPA